MKKLSLVLLFSCVVFSGVTVAQYVGPGATYKTSLAAILDNPVDDELVKLQGYLVKKVSSDKYIFTDGSAEIRVEIDTDVFPAQAFDENDVIEIMGEVEKDFLQSPEIDVDRITLVK